MTGTIASIAVDGPARASSARREAARDVVPAAAPAFRSRVLEAQALAGTNARPLSPTLPFLAQMIGQAGDVLTDARQGFDRYAEALALGRPRPGVSGGTHWYA